MPEYSIDRLVAMPEYPFKDYQIRTHERRLLCQLWLQYVRRAIGRNVVGEWVYRTESAPDGNPLLSLIEPTRERALTIVDKRNDEQKVPYPAKVGHDAYYGMQAWLNQSADENAPLDIVFFADVEKFDTYRGTFDNLLRIFFIERHSENDVEKHISEYESSVGMPE